MKFDLQAFQSGVVPGSFTHILILKSVVQDIHEIVQILIKKILPVESEVQINFKKMLKAVEICCYYCNYIVSHYCLNIVLSILMIDEDKHVMANSRRK
jgi:hypothetical protein